MRTWVKERSRAVRALPRPSASPVVRYPSFLPGPKWKLGDVQAIAAQVVVERVEAAGGAHALVDAGHLVEPEGVQIVGIGAGQALVLGQALEEVLGLGLGGEFLLAGIGGGQALDVELLRLRFTQPAI